MIREGEREAMQEQWESREKRKLLAERKKKCSLNNDDMYSY